MNDSITQYLETKGSNFRLEGQEKVTKCPFCQETKGHFYVNDQKGVFYCHKCSERGNIWKLKRHYGDVVLYQPFKKSYKKPQKDIDSYIKALNENTKALDYLTKERGFTRETIEIFKLGYNNEYITIPYYQDRELVNIKYRSITEKKFKREEGCLSALYNIDNLDRSKDIILVEGEFDCIAAIQLGFKNVISTSIGAGGLNPDWVDVFDSCSGDFYITYDNEKSGEVGAEKIANLIGRHRSFRVNLPLKDFNDCLMAGYKQIELLEYFTVRKDFSLPNLVHITKVMHKVDELYLREDKGTGLQLTNWRLFNQRLGGIRETEITVITGETASGKTTFTLNIFYELLYQNENVLIVSTEMPVKKVISKLFSIHKAKPFIELTQEEYTDCIKYFSLKNIFFIDVHGKLEIENLRDSIEYAVRKYKVKYVMLDHLHFFIESGAERMVAEIERFMRELVALALRTEVSMFLIAHPSKLKNEKGIVNINDLKGASAIKQDAHNIATLWRKENSNEVILDFQKVRDDSGIGGKVKYEFDLKSQTYWEG